MSRTKCATRGRSLRYSAAFCGRSVNTLPSTRSQAPARGCVLQSSHVHRYWQRMRHDPTIAKTGSIAAFGVALSYLASSLCAVLMPPELQGRPDVSPHQFWMVLSQDPLAHLAFHWSWVAAGFFGLAAVPAISLVVWPANRGAVLWSAAGAFCGFAVLARSHLMEVALDRTSILHYHH